MKKILSAVFVMTMLVITATFASSVLAADPYQYTPDDGKAVVYVSATGDVNSSLASTNGKEFATIGAAVSELGSKGGYIIVLDEIDVGRSYVFPSHKAELITIRGRDDVGSEYVKLNARYMCQAQGPYAFENIHLNWYKVDANDNDQSLQCGQNRVIFGEEGKPDSIKVTGMETITGSKFVINGGTFSIRMATWGTDVSVSDVDIVLNGGTINNISGAHSGPADKIYGITTKGDFSITVNGGTFKPSGINFTQPNNNKFNIGGDFKITINGGTISAGEITPVVSGKTPKEFNIGGNTIVNILGYTGDKAALASKFKASAWNIVMSDEIYVSDAGDDSAAGTADAPVATIAKAIEKLGAKGGVVNVKDTLTVDSYTEATRTAPVVITGDTLVLNGDFSIGGKTIFMGVDIKNGVNGAIVANGKQLSVMADVTTSVGADGKYIDLVAGKRDGFVVVDIVVKAGTYNIIDPTAIAAGSKIEIADAVETVESGVRADEELNALKLSKGTPVNATIELIDFVNDQQALKVNPDAEIPSIEYSAQVNGKYYKFASFEYYVHIKDGDTASIVPELVINGQTFVAEQAAATNGWNVASFDVSSIGAKFESITFYPYGQTAVAKHNKMYVFSIKFSQLKSVSAPDYGKINITAGGDFIPVLADYVMGTNELVNTANITNVEVKEAPFVVGTATMYKPLASTNISADYYVLKDGSISSLRGVFMPFIKVEYYLYAREGDAITEGYPTLKIGAKTYVATQPLVTNKWAVATFNVADYDEAYQSFTFLPYGAASGLNEWNKLYVQKIKVSQTEDKAVPTYSIPDMTEDGELIPYVFDPAEEGLEVHPVIYVNVNGGVLTGADPIEKSIDSTHAYGTLAAAYSAANASKQAVYMILVDDVVVGSTGTSNIIGYVNQDSNFPSNTNIIIMRGMIKSDETRTKLYISGMPKVNGPLWLQNIDIMSASTGDTYFALQGYNFSLGTPGGDDNDVIFGKYAGNCAGLAVTFGGDGGNHTRSPIVSIYSGTINTTLKLSGAYGGTTMAGDVTVNVYGGNLTGTSMTNGHSVADKNMGDVNINIMGGKIGNKWELVNNSNSYIEGNINVKISGNPNTSAFGGFGIAPYNAGNTTGLKGIATIDILEYEGADFEALKAKVSNFNVKFINSVYVKDGGTGNGSSVANACGNLDDAFAACYKENADGSIEGGRVVICGEGFTIEGEVEAPANAEKILITSADGAALKFQSGTLVLNGPVNFKNIKFENTNEDDAIIAANGNSVVFDTGITGAKVDGGDYVSIVGGNVNGTVDKVDITIASGDYQNVVTGDSVNGDVSIVIDGGKVYGYVVGGTSVEDGVIEGDTNIVINGGEFPGTIVGGNDASNGTINKTANIVINGGEFSGTIIASNNTATGFISGNAQIEINGGDFSDMTDGQIQAGIGESGDKICINFKNYSGNMSASDVESKIASNFDVVVKPLPDKPVFTEADKFIYIIASYGDPTKALTKSIPFKITQSAAQTAAPIVVSPKQLNLKVDGGDHANLSLQTVKDTGDTIRIIPNHNPTKGSRIVVDGYNINGRGVDVTKYKYIEIVYYYTVPEGDTPAVSNMAINYLGDFSKISGTSGTLVPNKWTSTIIDLTGVGEGITGNLKQYHFSPMGANKKGTDVPVNQYIDIMSMTFYTDKPQTTIQGGNAPGAKIVEPEEKPVIVAPTKPAGIEDIVVNVVNLKSTVDNSGAFTAAQVSKDGMTVMEYTPNLESAKELRIEGYNCMGKLISLNDYQYLTMKILVETKRTDVAFKPQITNCNGGVADNPEKAKTVTWTSETALVPNEWTTVTLKIAPADPAFHITRQFHIAPIGMIKGNTMKEGEKFYLAEFVLSNKPPKAPAAADGEEVVEVEQEVIEEAPAVVVEGAKLLNSAGDFATFKSTVGEFDGKQVVRISANKVDAPVAIDGSAIFGNTEQTPDGALSLKKHRYAVITYYYDSADATSERIPEFTLLGGRIQDKGNTVNGVVAKGTNALKKNEWATAVVKLSGNGKGELTSGFTLRPFGNVSANSIPYGDVLYIENITFVSNLPQ